MAITLFILLGIKQIDFSYASKQGYLGDSLSTALLSRSQKTKEQFILTKKALDKEKGVGAQAFLNYWAKSKKIWGWTLIYLSDENPNIILRLAEKNQKIWEPFLKLPPLGRRILADSMFPGVSINPTNRMFSEICGVNLELRLSQDVNVFISHNEGVPYQELCKSYMLLLAANNITVKHDNNRLIAVNSD